MLLRVTLGNHSSAEACEDFHARAAIAGTSSCNLLFIQIPDDFQRIPSNFNYSEILWNSFYSPNWLSPSHCFILLLLGGVAYSQCLLKFVGLASFNTVLSQTQSKKNLQLSKSWRVISQKWCWKQSFQHLSYRHSNDLTQLGCPKITCRAQLMCLYPAQRDSLRGLHPDTTPGKGKAKQKAPNTRSEFQNKVNWPSFMFIKQ